MIDRIRKRLQARLDELLAEADKLRRALVALTPGRTTSPARPKPRQRPRADAARPRADKAGARATAAKRSSGRTAPGATKARVPRSAQRWQGDDRGRGRRRYRLGRATVSTTLSKLAQSGEAKKAERGYQRPA